jgi:hypothetical protein
VITGDCWGADPRLGHCPILEVVALTTTTSEAATGVLVQQVADPLFSFGERQALAGFLSDYGDLTRDAYTLDLRQYTALCTGHGRHLFEAKRVDIEILPRRHWKPQGEPGPPSAADCTIAGFCPLRRGGRVAHQVPGRARAPPAAGLRIARHRVGPQRARAPSTQIDP